jgi:hypothetical protein
MKDLYHKLSILFGILGSLIAVLAIAVFEGYITESDVGNMTDGLLGTVSALTYVAAVGFAVAAKEE